MPPQPSLIRRPRSVLERGVAFRGELALRRYPNGEERCIAFDDVDRIREQQLDEMVASDRQLTPPAQVTLLISLVLAILALVFRFSGVEFPVVGNHPFATLMIGYLVLLAGNLFEGI